MIDDEHVLATFNEHYNLPTCSVLLVLSDSDGTALNPMLKHRESK